MFLWLRSFQIRLQLPTRSEDHAGTTGGCRAGSPRHHLNPAAAGMGHPSHAYLYSLTDRA